MKHYNAFPLLLMPLDSQIRYRGGRGFNCDVIVKPIAGSYSVNYEFETPSGRASITTLNEFQVGLVHYEDGVAYIMYCALKKEYFKFTIFPSKRKNAIGKKFG